MYSETNAVTVVYVAGEADTATPKAIEQAMLLTIADFYENRTDYVKRLPTAAQFYWTNTESLFSDMATKEQIGTMRERVTLQNVTEVQSTSGYLAETWATAGIVWAEVTSGFLPSGEEQMADRKQRVQVVNFESWTRGDVTEKPGVFL